MIVCVLKRNDFLWSLIINNAFLLSKKYSEEVLCCFSSLLMRIYFFFAILRTHFCVDDGENDLDDG